MSTHYTSHPTIPVNQLELAALPTIDFAKLTGGDASEAQRLLDACVTQGFFYLDLQGSDSSSKILADQYALLDVMKNYFDQPHEVKMEDNIESVTDGFKPIGTFAGVNRNSRDCYETLRVIVNCFSSLVVFFEPLFSRSPTKNILNGSSKMPVTIQKNISLISNFVFDSHFITHTILARLSDALQLQGSARFESNHRDEKPSTTTLVLLHYPQNFDSEYSGHNKHTDIGSLTLLFTPQWGLQLLSPVEKAKSWLWVEPRPGHAVINVGDSLRFLSGKRFKSCLHRVVPTGGMFQEEDRYSIAYFLRPESDIDFEDSDGKTVSVKKWHDEKYIMYTQTHETQDQSTVLTGGMEQTLLD
ncbi:putative 2-oxoglutarate-dependent dioxygenase At3g49630 [Mycena venus]|uniref:Putative 2-oxoglutarate-dependent dioxygenase At3g49630 n=1 Tax=Mycena venus TaxID=2733690 RepID=A0A8H6YP08_9AGAR|nr:putative 2-oxoglutarate-dependent dioxygenase At3g49630 [Mycena venus]